MGNFYRNIPRRIVGESSNVCSSGLVSGKERSFTLTDTVFTLINLSASEMSHPTHLLAFFRGNKHPPPPPIVGTGIDVIPATGIDSPQHVDTFSPNTLHVYDAPRVGGMPMQSAGPEDKTRSEGEMC